MAWHSIHEAQKLTGKSRRTLYRDMATGRISWAPEGDSGRRLETSELIRAYGELKPLAQPEAEKVAHGGTVIGTAETSLILAEMKVLREEIAELRQSMRLIEYKPEQAHPDTSKSVPETSVIPWWKRPLW